MNDEDREALKMLTIRVTELETARRMLTLKEASVYCLVTAKRFAAVTGIAAIELPHGKKVYDIRDLDNWIDSLKPQVQVYDLETIKARWRK